MGAPLVLVLVCSLPNVTLIAVVSVMSDTSLFPHRVISTSHMKMMKNSALVGNTGHFGNKIDFAGSEGLEGMKVANTKPQKIVSSSPLVTV